MQVTMRGTTCSSNLLSSEQTLAVLHLACFRRQPQSPVNAISLCFFRGMVWEQQRWHGLLCCSRLIVAWARSGPLQGSPWPQKLGKSEKSSCSRRSPKSLENILKSESWHFPETLQSVPRKFLVMGRIPKPLQSRLKSQASHLQPSLNVCCEPSSLTPIFS